MSGLFAGTSLERPVTCERCSQPIASCRCPRDRATGKVLRPQDQAVRIRREQRRGKFVTVVAGLAPRSDSTDDLPDLLKALKKSLGVGGSIETNPDGSPSLLLQGDHRDRLVQHFRSLNYPAKPAGG